MHPNQNPTFRLSRRRVLGGVGAVLAPALLGSAMPNLAHAQNATATAQPSPEAISMVQFNHPEKVYFYLPGFEDDAVRAGIYRLDVETYLAIQDDFAAAARGAAEELLADDALAEKVDRLPFRSGALVIAIGESDTDDLQSWFEILRHLLDLRRPRDGIQLVNAGISGQTTTQAVGQLIPALARQPDWIFCLLGGNDAALNGAEPTKTLVSIDETEKNLTEMRRLARTETSAQWVWLTRTPVDEERVEAFPGFRLGSVVWRNADMEAVNAFLRRQPEPVVDTYAAFGDPRSSALLSPDGLHPSLVGQQTIARAVVERLTA
jgi:lysophospholipase L1-like esterase